MFRAVRGASSTRRILHYRQRMIYHRPNSMLVRPFTAATIPKILIRGIRVPAMLVGVTTGGLAYVNYKIQEATNYTKDIFTRAADGISSSYDGIKSKFDGWNGIEMPEFHVPEGILKLFNMREEGSSEEGNRYVKEDTLEDAKGPASVLTAISVLGLGGDDSDDSDQKKNETRDKDNQMMVFTRKMIEIRSLLNSIGQTDQFFTLPSIVVIGSQSSGKSSVLEAIVGHEFLPKGNNMVTRRPIELTLIHTPDEKIEYGEFPALGKGKITDFSAIQKILTELNLAVPSEIAVSDDPIELRIHSPFVPDLTLIDLPGYIQVETRDQPENLKNSIAALCEKYIQPPNLILAVCAADVDLANSTALRAGRRVDPLGKRTIGVITKMDLVDPERGTNILTDKNYPLALGYVGVVTKAPKTSILKLGSSNMRSAIAKNENDFFTSSEAFKDAKVGTETLRSTLMKVLEKRMAASLQSTSVAVQHALEDVSYDFKVQYNDRFLSSETYLAETVDSLKSQFKDFSSRFGKTQVQSLLKAALDQKVLDLLADRYWKESARMTNLTKAKEDDPYWNLKVDTSAATLTKSGVGRLATDLLIEALSYEIENIIEQGHLKNHPGASDIVRRAANDLLQEKYQATSDQVENCIKPFKYEIEVDDSEWTIGKERVITSLKREAELCEDAFNAIKKQCGKQKLYSAMSQLEGLKNKPATDESNRDSNLGFSPALLAKAEEADFLRNRSNLIRMRIKALGSKQCRDAQSKAICPEAFFDVVTNKLTSTAVLFLNVELLSNFFYQFPRELDRRLLHMDKDELTQFVSEDPKVQKHVEMQLKKEMLELALEKLTSLMGMERLERDGKEEANKETVHEPRKRFGLF